MPIAIIPGVCMPNRFTSLSAACQRLQQAHADQAAVDPLAQKPQLVNCNGWFTSKFEEPFDKLRVNGQGTSRSW